MNDKRGPHSLNRHTIIQNSQWSSWCPQLIFCAKLEEFASAVAQLEVVIDSCANAAPSLVLHEKMDTFVVFCNVCQFSYRMVTFKPTLRQQHWSYHFCVLFALVYTLNGLAVDETRPPMGWASWGKYGCNRDCAKSSNDCIGARLILRTANEMVQNGLFESGYRHIFVDDCWHTGSRDEKTGRYKVSAAQFPRGITDVRKRLDDLHMGLSLLFIDECHSGKPSSVEVDVDTARDYGLSVMRIHTCSTAVMPKLFAKLSYSPKTLAVMCTGAGFINEFLRNPNGFNWNAVMRACYGWRVHHFSKTGWDGILEQTNNWIAHSDLLRSKSGPHHWNVQATLGITDKGMTDAERRTQMAIYCMLSFPLIFSDDVSRMDPYVLKILKNSNLIKINQDVSKPAIFLRKVSGVQFWSRKLSTACQYAIAFVNENSRLVRLNITMKEVIWDLPDGPKHHFVLTELFGGNSRNPIYWNNFVSLEIGPHDTDIYVVQF